jgi:protein-disulfide isomerase
MLNKLNDNKGNIWVAVSVIIAGVIIAAAVIFSGDQTQQPGSGNGNVAGEETQEQVDIPVVTDADYIQGNPDAPITIVEYSDPECPFCLRLHPTLKQIVEEYDGQVSWVYRHLNTRLHRKLLAEATAAECAGELAGNDGFWTMLNRIYATTPGNDGLDLDLLPQFATEMGLDLDAYTQCVDSGKYIEKVAQQTADAFAAGGSGTPFSVIITPEGNQIQISGAQPINVWRQAIDFVIENEITNTDAE